jgi:hypothetical protein
MRSQLQVTLVSYHLVFRIARPTEDPIFTCDFDTNKHKQARNMRPEVPGTGDALQLESCPQQCYFTRIGADSHFSYVLLLTYAADHVTMQDGSSDISGCKVAHLEEHQLGHESDDHERLESISS